ncbi:MAG: CDP-diacylglycerol--serine O-phosphatidyltransferase [Thermoplasmatota archaeon]
MNGDRRRGLRKLYPSRDGRLVRGGRKITQRLIRRPMRPIPLSKLIAPADVITLMNFLCGIMAVMSSIDKGDGFRIAMLFILLGVIFDGLDGPVARRFGSSHKFGVWLDSIADAVTFCIAPAILVYNLYRDPSEGFFDSLLPFTVITASISIALLGILRLAKFSIYAHRWKNFIGLPTPAMAIMVVCLSSSYLFSSEIGLEIEFITTGTVIVLPLIFFLASLLMVADIRYKKVRGRLMLVVGFFTLCLIICLAIGNKEPEIALAGSIICSILALSYTLSPLTQGPGQIWGASKREEEFDEEDLYEEGDIGEEEGLEELL